jgi:hypothetical protein
MRQSFHEWDVSSFLTCMTGVMKGIYFQRSKNQADAREYKSFYINHDANSWFLILWMSVHIALLSNLAGKVSNCYFAGRLRWAGVLALIPLICIYQYNFTCFWKCVAVSLMDCIGLFSRIASSDLIWAPTSLPFFTSPLKFQRFTATSMIGSTRCTSFASSSSFLSRAIPTFSHYTTLSIGRCACRPSWPSSARPCSRRTL